MLWILYNVDVNSKMAALIAYYMAARIQGDCYNFERMKINIDIAIREQFARQTMKEMPRQAKSFI